ncbi:hypothetical protein AB0J80_27790 [Actinoplanes sp. NPDC049548]|uniref:hypothetical protein n=1 Tax=Actinoplanes sp. NPDC049548 TaxID=3155152 RepID=UPI00341300FF
MRFINSVADRLLEKVAPTVTADAGCIFLYSTKDINGFCPGNPLKVRVTTTVYYDNCRPKVTSNC